MKNQQSAIVFDQKTASAYDNRWAKLAPIRDSLDLLIRAILSELPADARILCVGVGTGSELINLAQAFPLWRFTAVEPAIAMLDVCRQRVEECGITSRCTFHEGYLDSLPESDSFEAATCLVVSHFIMEKEERRNFFNQIALRLRPQGYLISSDIVYDMSTSDYQSLLEVWLRMMKSAELPEDDIEKMRAAYGRDVAVLPPQEVASIIASAGFDTPVLFFQNLLIHAWYSRRTSSN
ncbi:class I SAM-dependent methyltransferase [Chlorogloea sp. CCALA 695]|uniref:class I SAM-dependent methyltransferase n=1 Tax=Chlorogloea sp. CCALA 695 TaxID=2107693 RepID=UPI000D082D59|nr:class I SAM-dependent methyltransferase [Chlorogloea sp. CCALA 695]PSB27304.1 SAM-dependent methyltransferase [Chlorogloea sp. CCALA 695]